MSHPRNAVVLRFQSGDDRLELDRLRRLTGLKFDSVPQSLLAKGAGTMPEAMTAARPTGRPVLVASQGSCLSAPDHQ